MCKYFWLCIVLSALASGGMAAEPVISVLQKDGVPLIQPAPPPPYIEVLDGIGLRVDFSAGVERQPLTWDKLKQYNLLVMTNFISGHGSLAYDAEQLADLLDRYLQAGGAILYIGQEQMEQYTHADQVNAWLQRYGARIPWATIDDPEHTYDNPPRLPFQRNEIIWTTNLADHPATRGAESLFLRNSIFYSPYLRPLELSDAWTALVSSMPSSTVVPLTLPKSAGIGERLTAEAKPGPAPVLAVREVGKGRLAIFSSNPGPFWYDLGKAVGGQVCASRGDGQRTSDWLPLLRSLSLWLTEPAREAGTPGGATSKVAFKILPDWGSREGIDWERPEMSWPDSEIDRLWRVHSSFWTTPDWREMLAGHFSSYKILVGARTALSGGKGTVAEWAAAAKAAGFDGIAFREEILKLTQAQWEAFEEACVAASDDSFICLPGQQFESWEGNRFYRFNRHIPWHGPGRLTEDGSAVREQLHFFFDAGWNANFPLSIQENHAPWWSYRVYNGVPVAIYRDGKQVEENLEPWKELVYRGEYPAPMAFHLLDDPAQVAASADGYHLRILAPSMEDIRTNPRWQRGSMGVGHTYCTVAYLSSGPEIQAFQPINGFRTSLGDPGLPGTYRYRIFIRVKSDAPLDRVELWADGQLLRSYRPEGHEFLKEVDDIHDRQRGLYLRVVDTAGGEALATSFNVHDKMMYLQWCGDHCNILGGGTGVDTDGNPQSFGVGTHVKLRFGPGGGPGAANGEAWNYIPNGTDTSSPTIGLMAQVAFTATDGQRVPESRWDLIPDVQQWHGSRNLRIHRHDVRWLGDREKYLKPGVYDSGYFSAWGAYFTLEPSTHFDLVHDDIDFHRNGGQPSFQFCRESYTFKAPLELGSSPAMNLTVGRSVWDPSTGGFWLSDGTHHQANLVRTLGRGGYVTWEQPLGNATLFALDDAFSINIQWNAANGRHFFYYGAALGQRSFAAGDKLGLNWLIMRWPVGMPREAGLDEIVSKLLLRGEASSLRLQARQGACRRAPFGFEIETRDHAFRGSLGKAELSMKVPLMVRGLNANWTAAIWRPGQQLLPPLAPDAEGVTWALMDPATEHGEFFLGNVLTSNRDDLLLRVMARHDGSWQIVAHNPTDRRLRATVEGSAGGPLAGLKRRVNLASGEEFIWTIAP